VILADKGNVTIQDQEGTTTLEEWHKTTRDEKKAHRKGGAQPAERGGILSSTPAIIIGGAVVAGGTGWILPQHTAPASPSCPMNPCQWIVSVGESLPLITRKNSLRALH
jgi:hypothetical protein